MRTLAGDVATVLDALSIPRVHYIGLSIGGMIGQAFAIEHGAKLISAMWCDTLPASPSGATAAWDERMDTVRRANSLEPIADATMERWFTDAFKAKNPGRWKQIRDTDRGHDARPAISAARRRSWISISPGGCRRCRRRSWWCAAPKIPGTPAPRKPPARRARPGRPLRGDRRHDAISPMSRRPTPSTASCWAGSNSTNARTDGERLLPCVSGGGAVIYRRSRRAARRRRNAFSRIKPSASRWS